MGGGGLIVCMYVCCVVMCFILYVCCVVMYFMLCCYVLYIVLLCVLCNVCTRVEVGLFVSCVMMCVHG